MNHTQPVSIFVLVDALGWEFLKGRSFLDDELPHRAALKTILGFSSGAIPAILTGLPPAHNGHWNLFYYDPKSSPFRWMRPLACLPPKLLDNRVARKLFKEAGRRLLGLGKTFECKVSPRLLPWFSFVETRDIYAPGGIGGARSVFDQLAAAQKPYGIYTYRQGPDSKLLERAQRDVADPRLSFFFLYLSEMDLLLHDHWGEADVLDRKLRSYEQGLQILFQNALRRDEGATFCVFSDHGMTPVRWHFDLAPRVNACGFSMPDDYLCVYDSTMARFWFFSEDARRKVTELLSHLECGRVLPDEELEDLGIFFPDRRYGEVIFLLHPGWMLSRSDFNGPGWMPAGMHGYHPDDPYSDAIFLSNHAPTMPVRTIADVYPLLWNAVEERPAAAVPVGQTGVGA